MQLGWKGLSRTSTVAYWAHSIVRKKITYCEIAQGLSILSMCNIKVVLDLGRLQPYLQILN